MWLHSEYSDTRDGRGAGGKWAMLQAHLLFQKALVGSCFLLVCCVGFCFPPSAAATAGRARRGQPAFAFRVVSCLSSVLLCFVSRVFLRLPRIHPSAPSARRAGVSRVLPLRAPAPFPPQEMGKLYGEPQTTAALRLGSMYHHGLVPFLGHNATEALAYYQEVRQGKADRGSPMFLLFKHGHAPEFWGRRQLLGFAWAGRLGRRA